MAQTKGRDFEARFAYQIMESMTAKLGALTYDTGERDLGVSGDDLAIGRPRVN